MKLTYRNVRTLFHFGTELLGKLPSRHDTIPEILVKLLAMADAGERVYGGKKTVYADVFTRYDLRERTSEAFVRMFWGTKLSSRFTLCRHGVDEHLELVEAKAPNGERLFFQEHRYGRPEMSADFFHTPGFDFAAAMDALWAEYPAGIYLSVQQGRWAPETTFCAVPARQWVMRTSRSTARVQDAVQDHAARAGEPWCFLATGEPGTGKSSFAEGFATAIGARLLKVDAASLPRIGVQEFGFLLDALRPGVLLVDDVDRAPVDDVRARILFLFEHLHDRYRGVTVALTVNDPSKLDQALLRSERIDEAIEFSSPDAQERTEIVASIVGAGHESVRAGVDATEGFGHADVAGFARRLRRQPFDKALDQVTRLRALASRAAQSTGAPTPDVIAKAST